MDDVEVICVGAAKFDLNAVVERFPAEDERVLASALDNGVGGPAMTAAVALARLGVSVGFCGVIGRDPPGDFVMGRLEAEGISTRWVQRPAGVATGRSMNIATSSTGTRAIVTVPAPAPDVAQVAALRAPWIHIDDIGYAPSRTLRRERPLGMRFSLDGGNHIDELDVAGIDLYAPTLARLLSLHGKGTSTRGKHTPQSAMAEAVAAGARDVVATAGSDGAYVLAQGILTHVPGFAVPVVSSLGAGDVFHGALVAGLCIGKSLVEAVRWANACAALACRGIDGQSMIPMRPELEHFLAEH